jgi:hypothetical protein
LHKEGGEEWRVTIDYQIVVQELNHFSSYWEDRYALGRLSHKTLEDFVAAAECISILVKQVWNAEPEADAGTILWPAIDRYLKVALRLDQLRKEESGKPEPEGGAVVDLQEFVLSKRAG